MVVFAEFQEFDYVRDFEGSVNEEVVGEDEHEEVFEDFGGGIDFVLGSVLEGEEIFEVFAVEGEEEFGAADGLPFDGELNI